MRASLLLGLVGLAAAAAGLPTDSRGDVSAAARATAVTCPGRGAGTVTGIVFPTLRVNGARVSRRLPLKRGDRIQTDRNGQAQFCVKRKTTRCDTRRDSRVRIQPQPSVVLRFEAGRTYCSTASGGTARFDVARGGVRLRVGDPLFSVAVEPRRTVIKVVLGFVGVRKGAGPEVLVGPGKQVVVPTAGPPQAAEPIATTREDLAAFRGLERGLPAPELGRPAVSGSHALRRIFSRGTLLVSLFEGATAQARAFERSYFESLASSWRLAVRLEEVRGGSEALVARLETGEADAVVAWITEARDPAFEGLSVLPFYTHPAGSRFYLVTRPDAGLVAALVDYLNAALVTGRYGAQYRASFGGEPAHAGEREVLFPSDAAAATAPTRQLVFQPVVNGRAAPGVRVVRKSRGVCRGRSLRDVRREAWQCDAGDPCFSGIAGVVLCPQLPLESRQVTEMTLEQPLPVGQANPGAAATSADPWVIRTTDVRTCLFVGGATFIVGGERVNYGCVRRGSDWGSAGFLVGRAYRGDQPWTILGLPVGATPGRPGHPDSVRIAEAQW